MVGQTEETLTSIEFHTRWGSPQYFLNLQKQMPRDETGNAQTAL